MASEKNQGQKICKICLSMQRCCVKFTWSCQEQKALMKYPGPEIDKCASNLKYFFGCFAYIISEDADQPFVIWSSVPVDIRSANGLQHEEVRQTSLVDRTGQESSNLTRVIDLFHEKGGRHWELIFLSCNQINGLSIWFPFAFIRLWWCFLRKIRILGKHSPWSAGFRTGRSQICTSFFSRGTADLIPFKPNDKRILSKHCKIYEICTSQVIVS